MGKCVLNKTSKEMVLGRIIKIAENATNLETITGESRFIDDLDMDSLDQIETVMDIEEEFGIEISEDEAEAVATINDAVSLVLAKLGNTAG